MSESIPEVYPNITWEVESRKVFAGEDYCKGTASMCRACHAQNQLSIAAIKGGADPLKVLENTNQWLAQVLYSANMNNFK